MSLTLPDGSGSLYTAPSDSTFSFLGLPVLKNAVMSAASFDGSSAPSPELMVANLEWEPNSQCRSVFLSVCQDYQYLFCPSKIASKDTRTDRISPTCKSHQQTSILGNTNEQPAAGASSERNRKESSCRREGAVGHGRGWVAVR